MKGQSISTIRKISLISWKMFISYMLLFCLSGAISVLSVFLEIRGKWLEIISALSSIIGGLLLVLSWIAPGVFIALRMPWLAHAWLRGLNPMAVSSTSWEELSFGRKVLIYFYAIGSFAFTIFAVLGLILFTVQN